MMDAHSLERLDFFRARDMLADHAMTSLGRALAGTIRPIARIELVRRWLDQFEELRRLREQRGLPPFGGVTDVREIVARCGPPLRVSVEEVAALGRTLRATHELAEYLRDLPAEYPELRHVAERVGDFRTIAARIGAVIDERSAVRDDASPKLARIRHDMRDAAERIRAAVDQLLHDPQIRKLLQYPNHTFHGDRMVLPVRTECRGRLPGIVHRSSDSGATVYVEPAEAVELNNRISGLRAEESEEIARLLWELSHEVHLNAEAITKTVDTLAVLDLITAKVRWADAFELRAPELREDAALHVRDARHPLLVDLVRQRQAAGGPVVPVSYRVGEDFDLLVITGPNTGGKTITLKTIGLLSLMVQSGLPVPVGPGSSFGLFRSVLIDIGDEQSLQQSLSTFSAHLKRQLDMLQKAGPRTLVLIDELGAGTDPDEGSAISRAILDELLSLQCRCIVTTHIGALKNVPLTRPRSENACVDFDPESLRPTFQLRIGQAGMSNAINIAQGLGMPKRLVTAARQFLSPQVRALHRAMEGTSAAKRQAEAARDAAERAKLRADQARREAHSAREQLERDKANFNNWLQRVVHLRAGDPVRVRNFDRDGRLVRLRLDHQRAEIDVGSFAVEVPLSDVLPPETAAPPPRAPRPAPAAATRQDRRPRRTGPPPRPTHPQAGPATVGTPGAAAHGPSAAGGTPTGDAPHADRAPPQVQASKAPLAAAPLPRSDRPRPQHTPLSSEQAAALKPGDVVFATRFQREGRVVRVSTGKRQAVVNVGLLEVELSFESLALPRATRDRQTPTGAAGNSAPGA
jgi:DNA mismatch repair protein MutS2